MTTTEVGRARLRKEDAHLITGRSKYTDNITLPGMLHLAMVRSPFAHAKITSVDVAAAKSSPGVVAVLTGSDVAAEQGSLPNAWPITPDQKAPRTRRLPWTRFLLRARWLPASSPAAPPPPATPSNSSTSTTRS
ncbi:hypothetical protein [Arthrobacter sp. 24S4-2]|uniref:hypothetical protein n=1 Tax=Arthrobacter sp. 24S4-2 TaxID=2575374 RepID=UPI0034A0CE20